MARISDLMWTIFQIANFFAGTSEEQDTQDLGDGLAAVVSALPGMSDFLLARALGHFASIHGAAARQLLLPSTFITEARFLCGTMRCFSRERHAKKQRTITEKLEKVR